MSTHRRTRNTTTPVVSRGELAACTFGDIPDWGPAQAQDLMRTLLSAENPFPCTFAVAAAKKRTLRFGYVDSVLDEGTWGAVVDILTAYLECYKDLGRDTSLVVFFGPGSGTSALEDYFERFWSVLQFLHEKDASPWPAEVPADPDDAWWEFSFGGTEIFVVCNNPAHVQRRSRHSPGFMITFQPRWVFDGLAPDSDRGSRARQVIRQRIRRFDGMEPAPELGDFGDPDNREWRQYFLDDGPGTQLPGPGCPFHARGGSAAQVPPYGAASPPPPEQEPQQEPPPQPRTDSSPPPHDDER